jgi:multicomponent Na+:H+ antiporter subunit B
MSTNTWRTLIFLVLLAAAAPAMIHGLSALPPFGDYRGPYGDIVNHLVVPARHVTNAVTAVNFDFRGLDTLGEELILFAATVGVAMLFRGTRGQATTAAPVRIEGRKRPGRSEAVALMARVFAPLTFVFGIYVVLHAQLTPGGGFQGGVILFAAVLLAYLADGYGAWTRLTPPIVIHLAESCGILVYLFGGLVSLALGGVYLQNNLPLGALGSIVSGGLIPILNAGVALAVAAGFCAVAREFLEETRRYSDEDERA